MLGGNVLKFGKQNSEPETCFYGKQTFNYFNNSLVNCDSSMVSDPIDHFEEAPKPRKIPSNPYRVLDAPGLCDDFYLNLVDWSAQNILAVALESAVYIWNATTSTVHELCDLGEED